MKSTTFKKALLAGTAIVAASAFSVQANAATLTLSGNAVWGTAANGMVATPTAGDDVVMTTNNLKFDTTEAGVLTAGAITATTGALTVDTTGDAGNVAFTIGSFAGSGAANVTVDNLNASTTRSVTLGVTNGFSTAGNVIIRNTEVGGSSTAVAVTVGGNYTTTGGGTTAITTTGTGQTATTASLTLNGATNSFSGAVTVTGGAADATNTSTLTISGASTTFTGGLALTNGAVGHAILNLNGSAAQSVTGVISSTGDINVTNTSAGGVTFVGDSTNTGALLVNNNGHDQRVTFTGDVASAITLGDNVGADTVTANFNGTTLAVSGGITGGGSTISNVNFLGGSTITLSGAASSAIDTTAISGNTTVTTNQNYGSTNITVASGSTLATTANTISGAIANSGTLNFGGGSVTGAITGTGAYTVTGSGAFNGALTQATGNIGNATLTQTTASGYTVGTTTFSNTGTLALKGGAQTVTGNFTNTTDGQGTITVSDAAGTTAIVGDLGASTAHSLAAFTILDGGTLANVVTTTGNLFVDATNVLATDTLSFIGTSAQTVSGNITGTGIHTIGAGSNVTFNGTVAGASEPLGANASAAYNGNATFSGVYTNAATSTSTVAVGKTLTAATIADAGSYILKANDANHTLTSADFGSLTDTGGGAASLTASKLHIDVTGDMGTGTVLLLTHINLGVATLDDTSAQYIFTTANAANDTNVTVTRRTLESISDNNSTKGAGAELDSLSTSANTQIAAAIDNIAAAGSDKKVNELVASTTSTVDGSTQAASQAFSDTTGAITEERLAMLRDGDEPSTGMAAGEIAKGTGVWLQGFGTHGNQNERDGVAGFDFNSYGGAIGVDTKNLSDRTLVGAAFSYAHTNANSDNLNSTDTDIDSYQLALYGNYDVDNRTYVAGQVGYIWGSNDTTRHNVGGISGLTANGSFNSDQIMARAEVGRNFMEQNNMKLTPKVIADYTNFNPQSYTETGAGGLNNHVDGDSQNIFNVGLGVDASWLVKHNDGAWCEPALHAAVRYDLVGDNVQSTNTFTGGGTAFTAQGADPARTTFDVGAGLTYHATNNWDFKAEYNFEAKSDYTSHSGLIKAGYKF